MSAEIDGQIKWLGFWSITIVTILLYRFWK